MSDEVAAWFAGKEFTSDWMSHKLEPWRKHLASLAGSGPEVLEIGSWEGRSATVFLEAFGARRITCVDTFKGGDEHRTFEHLDGLEARFDRNMAGYGNRVEKIVGRSAVVLENLVQQKRSFDVVYVDASHHMDEVLVDSILSWRLLRANGFIIWDDYKWSPGMKRAIDLFLAYKAGQYTILHKNWQIIARRGPLVVDDPGRIPRDRTAV